MEKLTQNFLNFNAIICIVGTLIFTAISLYDTLVKIVSQQKSKKQKVLIYWILALTLWLILLYNNCYILHTLKSIRMALITTFFFIIGTTVIFLLNLSIITTDKKD